jgi:nitrous oxide reductase accessory protein NosL
LKRALVLMLLAAVALGGCTKEQQEAPSKAVTDLEDRARSEVTQLNDREQQFEEQVGP